MTDPVNAPDADRAEQEALVHRHEITTAGDAEPPAADVPEADALEQQLVARPYGIGGPQAPLGDREANEADVLEQQTDAPVGEDDPEP